LHAEIIENFLDFREISDNLFDGIYISDGEGKTIFVNEAYTRITGIKKEQVMGRTVKEISEEGKLYKGAVTMDVLEQKQRVSSIGKSLVNNREHLVTGSPIFDENGKIRFVVINNRDITELRGLETKISQLQNDKLLAEEEIKFFRKQFANKSISSKDRGMKTIMDIIDTIAPTEVTVLITGESGTGKEVIADEIYSKSRRSEKPFIKINCAAIPSELLESELFGYEKGAFTDARKTGKIGMFELANEGTILLDEIGDMPLKLQTKLLRVLQNKEIIKLGSNTPIKLDIRVIASTNKDLHQEMLNGRFREDLYYRLNVVPINIKSLRERKDDIENLVFEFLEKFNKKYGKNIIIERSSLKIFQGYSWPGNIRELENLIERLVVINNDGVVKQNSIINMLNMGERNEIVIDHDLTLKEAVKNLEKEMIEKAIKNCGSVNKAAVQLGLSQPALWKKCKVLKIQEQRQ
jgi:PAS domain S-box-containing protein